MLQENYTKKLARSEGTKRIKKHQNYLLKYISKATTAVEVSTTGLHRFSQK